MRMARPDENSRQAYDGIRADQFDDALDGLSTGRIGIGRHERERIVKLLKDISQRLQGNFVSTPSRPAVPSRLAPLPVQAQEPTPSAVTVGDVKPSLRRLVEAVWILREPGSGTREASDRWLDHYLHYVNVDLELGTNEAVKRVVALGRSLGCLSRHTVADAIRQGWLVEVSAALPQMRRTLSIVLHRSKRLGSVSQDFLRHCQQPHVAVC